MTQTSTKIEKSKAGDIAKAINDGLVKCSTEQKALIFSAAIAANLASVPDYKQWLEQIRDEAEEMIEESNAGHA